MEVFGPTGAQGGNAGSGASQPAVQPAGTATPDSPTADSTPSVDTPNVAESPAPSAAPSTPQFGGTTAPVTDAQPAVTDDGGYVSSLPLLTSGAAGPIVSFLAELLHHHGFANDVHAGTAEAVLDDALMGIVRAFQAKAGVDPSEGQGGSAPLVSKAHTGLVDAKTWEALIGDAKSLAVGARYVVDTVKAAL